MLSITEAQYIAVACVILADMGFGLTLEVVGDVPAWEFPTESIYGWDPWKRLVAEIFEAVAMHKREKTTNVTTKRAASGVRDIINACSTSLRMCSGVQALMCPILLFQSNYGIVMSRHLKPLPQ